MNRALMFFAALLLLFCGAAFVWFSSGNAAVARSGSSTSEKDPDFVAPPRELEEFEFTDQLAKPFGSKDLEGKVWMASFFFASCPSICKQQNLEISKIHNRFKENDDVQIVNITVTPEEDTPRVLLLYAKQFDADHQRWKFLTGQSIDYVKQVGAEFFGLPAADETHTTDVALFDRQGERHGTYKVTDPREQAKLILKVEELLSQTVDVASTDETQVESTTEPTTSETTAVGAES